jgi:hypothetical protein
MRKIIRFIPVFCVLSLFACSNSSSTSDAESEADRISAVKEGEIILARSCGELDVLQDKFNKSDIPQESKNYLTWRIGEQKKSMHCN